MMDFFSAGTIAGACATVAGHPFDSVKIMCQITQHPSIIESAKRISILHGWKGFFHGLTIPLTTRSVTKGVNFAVYEMSLSKLEQQQKTRRGNHRMYSEIMAGMLSGCASGVIAAPTEFMKIHAQVIGKGYRNLPYKQIFKGFNVTLARDILFFAPYYTLYRQLKES